MKYLIILLGFMALYTEGASQTCNINTGGLSSPDMTNIYASGDTIIMGFRIQNIDGYLPGAANPSCSYAIGQVTVNLALPIGTNLLPKWMQYARHEVYSTSADMFTWTYLPGDNVLQGVNNVPIPGIFSQLASGVEFSDTVTVYSVATDTTSTPKTIGYSIDVFLGDDNPADNQGSYNIIVQPNTLLGIEFDNYIVSESNCKGIVEWQNDHENDIDYYVVQHTANIGRDWASTERINALQTRGAKYSKTLDLMKGKNYVRIEVHHTDGKVDYSEVRSVNMSCGIRPGIEVKTNPVHDGSITLLNTEKGDEMSLYDGIGRLIKTGQGIDDLTNVDVLGLSDGIYYIKVNRRGEEIFSSQVYVTN